MAEAVHSAAIRVDAGQVLGDMPHNWNYIGYDEINYTYTPEGQELLARFRDMQEKPYYVRAHHLLCTGNCHGAYKWGSTNAYLEDDTGQPVYDWTFVDLVFDTLLAHGCRPFVELGFMPQDLADPACYDVAQDTWTHQHYRSYGFACPPKDYQKWYALIFELVQHCLERYGAEAVSAWYWELWNEPDLSYYWKGTLEEFLKLYDYTAAAVKAAFPQARIGGPGTTNPDPQRYSGQFLDAFLDHCVNGTNFYTGTRGTPLDFISFHVKGGGYRADPKHRRQPPPSVGRILRDTRAGYEIIRKYPGLAALECVLSEIDPDGWAAGGAWDNINLNFRNTEYYPSFVAAAFHQVSQYARENQWDLRLLTWAFLFVGERCFEGTRAFSTQGIDKAILNLFRMYAHLGDQQLYLAASSTNDSLTDAPPEVPAVSGMATRTAAGEVAILIYHHHADWDRAADCAIRLDIEHLPFTSDQVTVQHYRIDHAHSNAYAAWVQQGRPMYPTPEQRAAIKAREGLELLEAAHTLALQDNGSLRLDFRLPAHAISLLLLAPATG